MLLFLTGDVVYGLLFAAASAVITVSRFVFSDFSSITVECTVLPREIYAGDDITISHRFRSYRGSVFIVSVLQRFPEGMGIGDIAYECLVRGERRLDFVFHVGGAGIFPVDPPQVRVYDIFRLRSMPLSSGNGYHISSMRRVERIDAGVVRPFHYTMQAGNIVSAFAGSGIEFHSVVSYAGSPESRRINWKTTARTGELWFNRYSSERSGTAVILLDLRQIASDEELTVRFAERAVQAALSFAYSSLQERNAVGMIAIGERVISIRTDFGRRHYERISRALMLMRPSREYSPVRLDAAASRYAHYASQLIVITPLHERDDVDSIASLSISHRDILLVVPMLHHRESAASAMQIAAEITRLRQQNNAIAASRFCRTFVWEQDVDLGMISELPGYAAGRMRR